MFAGAAAYARARMSASVPRQGRTAGGHGCRAGGDDQVIVEQAAPAGPRRSDAGLVRLSGRDVTGLLLCAEHYAVQYDLLASALGVQPPRLRGIVARWRRAGYAQTGTLGPGPAWCWLTSAGMSACGLGYPARPPTLPGWRTSARCWRPGCGWKPGRPGPTVRRGGAASGGSAPPCRPTPAPRTWPMRRSAGPRSAAARTPARPGRSRWS